MKKVVYRTILAISLILCFALSTYAAQNDGVKIMLDGIYVDCESYGQSAVIVEGRTLVPLRAIFESFGADVRWDSETKTVFSTLGSDSVKITIGDKNLYKNGNKAELDVPAQIINNRTMVPVRAVAEAFGAKAEWDSENRTVVLKYKTGVVYENVYYNEWMGLSFDFGEDFECLTGENLKEAIGVSDDITLNVFGEDSNGAIDCFAMDEKFDIFFAGFDKNASYADEYEYLNEEIQTLIEMKDVEVSRTSSCYKLKVANISFVAQDIAMTLYFDVNNTMSLPLYFTVATTEKDGYFFNFIIASFENDGIKNILSKVSEIDEMPKIENSNESANTNTNVSENDSEKSENLTYKMALGEMEEKFAKTEKDEKTIAEIGNTKITEVYFDFLSHSAKEAYPESSSEELAEMCFDYCKSVAFVEQYITEHNIELSREYLNIDNIENTFKFCESIYGLSMEEILSEMNMTPYTFAKNYVYNIFMSTLVFDEEFSSEAIDKTLEEFENSNYVRAKHILVTFDGEDEKLATREIAEQILSKVRENPENFDEFVELYGEDSGMESYPGGYYFTTGEMVEPFEKATFGLKEGEVSDIVETSYGYHIIKRLPMERKDFLSSSATSSEIYGNFWQESVNEKANEWYSSIENGEK